jgi:hypothetical protein
MIWLAVALVVVGLPLAALLFGADSRDGRDWQPLCGLPNSSLDTDWPSPHMAGAGGTGRLVPRRERVKQG